MSNFDNTIQGQYYRYHNEDNSVYSIGICKHSGTNWMAKGINPSKDIYKDGECYAGLTTMATHATPQEILHLNACIAADEYVEPPIEEKPKMVKAKEWLRSKLEGDELKNALRNVEKKSCEGIGLNHEGLEYSLGAMFTWDLTEEGFEYWENLDMQIEAKAIATTLAKTPISSPIITIGDWIMAHLEGEEQEKALVNAKKQGGLGRNIEACGGRLNIDSAFSWGSTKEKHEYWSRINTKTQHLTVRK